jgi:hypothetical protein
MAVTYVWFGVDDEGFTEDAEACGPTAAGPVQRCTATSYNDGEGQVHWKLNDAADSVEGALYIDMKALAYELTVYRHIEKNYVNLPKSTYLEATKTSGRCTVTRDKRRIKK